MTILFGNASAPRWWDLDRGRFVEYLALLVAQGATSTELVLHDGPSDEQTDRVHVPVSDLPRLASEFANAGIVITAHAPLSPRFRLNHWQNDRDSLKYDFLPILRAIFDLADRQQTGAVFVVHADSTSRDTTASFLNWVRDEATHAKSDVRFAIELRRVNPGAELMFDRHREGLTEFLDWAAIEGSGMCWDLANDWQNGEWNQERPSVEDRFISRVQHVHLHGVRADGTSHWPLQESINPWTAAVEELHEFGYCGAITMEIRYRHALSMGDPWEVLANSYSRVRELLAPRDSTVAADLCSRTTGVREDC